VTRLLPELKGSVPGRDRDSSLRFHVQPPVRWVPDWLVKVKNMWSYTSATRYSFMTRCVIQLIGNFTYTRRSNLNMKHEIYQTGSESKEFVDRYLCWAIRHHGPVRNSTGGQHYLYRANETMIIPEGFNSYFAC
jgi:hypothetical protein